MDALIDWPPEQATSINDTGEARRKEARLAAWKSRQGMHPQGCQQTTDDDVIVLD